jgi:hypothetical protein
VKVAIYYFSFDGHGFNMPLIEVYGEMLVFIQNVLPYPKSSDLSTIKVFGQGAVFI